MTASKNIGRKVFIALTLASAVCYIVDVISDMILARRYLDNGDVVWGSLTLTFILLSWFITVVCGIICFRCGANGQCGDGLKEMSREISMPFLMAAILNLAPIILLVHAANDMWRNAHTYARRTQKYACFVLLIEVFFEAFPQTALQLYIVSQTNHVDFVVFISVTLSMCSVVKGVLTGTICAISSRSDFMEAVMYEHELFFTLVGFTWLNLHLIALLPPLAFCASLKNHSSPGMMALVVYCVLHLCISARVTFFRRIQWNQTPKHALDYLRSRFSPCYEGNAKRRFPWNFCLSLALQLLFLVVGLWTASCWLVSVAPFADQDSFDLVPNFIWPETLPGLRPWIDSMSNETWAICDLREGAQWRGNATRGMGKMRDYGNERRDEAKSFFSMICLTDVAAPVYLCLVSFIVGLFVFHLGLALFWPYIYQKVVSIRAMIRSCEKTLRKEREELEATERELRRLRERLGSVGDRRGKQEVMRNIANEEQRAKDLQKSISHWQQVETDARQLMEGSTLTMDAKEEEGEEEENGLVEGAKNGDIAV